MVYSRQNSEESSQEPGLAEWTSKIKAMQRQVDADEEAEQRSLEEEIAASRLARMRRNNRSAASLNASQVEESPPKADRAPPPRSPVRRPTENNALARSPLQLNEEISSSTSQKSAKLASTGKPTSSEKQPISLAAFMGGRATGPRLNKHAPQQDVPFEQITMDRSVHPVFGAGGVAMPGMAALPSKSPKFPRPTAASPPFRSSSTPDKRPVASPTPSSTSRRSPSPNKSFVRERTVTLPTATTPQVILPASSSNSSVSSAKKLFETDAPKEERTRAVSLNPKLGERLPAATLQSSPTVNNDLSPQQASAGRSPSNQSAPWSQTRTVGLTSPSPPQKEVTPSISRLQGRGFVQTMVKKSAQLQVTPEPAEDISQGSKLPGKTTNVLDRWKPASAIEPTLSPSAQPLRQRSPTVGTSVGASVPPVGNPPSTTIRMVNPSPVIVPKPIISPKPTLNQNPSAPKLGSATTMHLYKPGTVSPAPRTVDELGFGASPKGRDSAISGVPASLSKPLYHPTKDRAKVSRKRKPASPDQAPQRVLEKSSPESLSTIASLPLAGDHQNKPSAEIDVPQADAPRRSSPGPAVRAVSPSLATRMAAFQRTAEPEIKKREAPAIPQTQGKPVPTQHGQQPWKTPSQPVGRSKSKVADEKQPTTRQPSSAQDPKPLAAPTSVSKARSRSRSKPHQNTLKDPETNGALKEREKVTTDGPRGQSRKRSRTRTRSKAGFITPSPERQSEKRAPLKASPPDTALPRAHSKSLQDTGSTPAVTDERQIEIFHRGVRPESRSVSQTDKKLETEITISEHLLQTLLARPSVPSTKHMHRTISVEVMAIVGNSASAIKFEGQATFHDTEILAIVHRSKPTDDDLVCTKVWAWEGRKAKLGEREQRKLQELGKHYGTSVNTIQQGFESRELVEVLGGTLVTRQGPRNHWSTENAAMHQVRSLGGVMFIDEKELNVEYLCSAFSYCVTFMDAVYTWHGRGSTKLERRAARKYADSLGASTPPTELEEGQDDNELFWVILGTEEYADADYWRWRSSAPESDPRIWRVDSTWNALVTPVEYLGNETAFAESIYLIDCFWEFYVLVGINAKSRRKDINLALRIASEMSSRLSVDRPYRPTVHAIFLPSRIPKDLRLHIRSLDELSLNIGELPDYMDVFPPSEILSHFSA